MAKHLKECTYVSETARQNGATYLYTPSQPGTIPPSLFYSAHPPTAPFQSLPTTQIQEQVPTQMYPPHVIQAMREQDYRLQQPLRRSDSLSHISRMPSNFPDTPPWPKNRQEAQERQMLRTFISNGWAFLGANNPEFCKFVDGFQSGFKYPNRNKLSGPLLSAEFKTTQDGLTKLQKGAYATGQCDGWKDITRNHLIAFMVSASDTVWIIHLVHLLARLPIPENLKPSFALLMYTTVRQCERLPITSYN